LLPDAVKSEQLAASDIVLLWRLVKDSRLMLVENDLLVGINLRFYEVIEAVEPARNCRCRLTKVQACASLL
jgi:hypothetical protein